MSHRAPRRPLTLSLSPTRGEGTRLLTLVVVLASSVVHAAPQRWALALGENRGLEGDLPLKYAEADARHVLQVLQELGELDPSRATLVAGADAQKARAALTALEQRLAAEATTEDVLIVYLSAHADEGALHLDGTRLPLAELMTFLERAPVAVAVLVVDSCRSGALTRLKGLKAVEGRRVEAISGALEGRVIITSSGADEYSQESDLVQGSFFTHHLLGGLRGPADASGDGQVTLDEAYAWAYSRTVESTFATSGGVQQPQVRVDLRGAGALTLTTPVKSTSRLLLDAPEAGEWLIASLEPNGPVSLVRKPPGPTSIALRPGAYAVRLRTDDGYRERKVELASASVATVRGDEMASAELVRVASKGSAAEARLTAAVGGALMSGLLAGLPFAAGAEVRLQTPKLLPGALGVVLGFRVSQGAAFSQFELEGRAGWLWRWSLSRVTLGLGPELGFVVVIQDNLPDASRRIGVEPYVGAAAEGRIRIAGSLALTLGVGSGVLAVKKIISGTQPVFRAAGFVGLAFDVL